VVVVTELGVEKKLVRLGVDMVEAYVLANALSLQMEITILGVQCILEM
jgi:hypothetical protein